MNVDPPGPSESDENPLRQTPDAANGTTSGPRGQTTETISDTPARLPKRIGQYHIKRAIASGGMGTVYEALQEKPRRTVALKLMRAGIASRSALRRFEYESQLLARLRHPGIAQVYDAGTHRDGEVTVPYFAMEYITGAKPVTDYAKEKKLGTRERMKLFANVCEAVHHGHQKGIIHRDLKPSNILVDSSGQVKIIDFGVARCTDSDMAVTTLQTDVGQLIGTLQYMSPEQCAADPHDIDTRSDVYALGVVFYEMLCERMPYELKGAAIHEATRVIREQEPTRLSTLNKTLRGDVETIAQKALEKDRDRRYQSASALAADIGRYLNNEAISAHPPSVIYQFRVFARRHKGFIGAVAAVFGVLIAGVIVSVTYAVGEARQRELAEQASEEAQDRESEAIEARDDSDAVVKFLSDMLAAVDPGVQGKDVTMRAVLDEASKTVGEAFVAKPLIEARLRHVIGFSYLGLGLYEEAERHATVAAKIRRRELGPRHRNTLGSINNLAMVLQSRGEFAKAGDIHRRNYEINRRVLGEEHPQTLTSMLNLASTLFNQGRYAEGEKLTRKTIDIQRRVLGEQHRNTLKSMGNLALALSDQGRYAEAEKLHRKHLEIERRVLGEEHPDTLRSMNNLTIALANQGKYAEAEKLFRKTLDIQRRVLGEEHLHTLVSMGNLAELIGIRGHLSESEELFRKTIENMRRALGNEHPFLAYPLVGLAEVLLKKGEPRKARGLIDEALRIRKAELPDDHAMLAYARSVLGECLTALGRYDEAEPLVLESYEKLQAFQGETGFETRKALPRIVKLYEAWHAAEPGKGYDTKGAEWRSKLPKEKAAEVTTP